MFALGLQVGPSPSLTEMIVKQGKGLRRAGWLTGARLRELMMAWPCHHETSIWPPAVCEKFNEKMTD